MDLRRSLSLSGIQLIRWRLVRLAGPSDVEADSLSLQEARFRRSISFFN